MSTPREIFEIISLGLTPVVVMLSGAVLLLWGGRAIQGLRRGKMSELEWLILGISISFLGKFGDNIWWGIAWHFAHAGDIANRDWWFSNGVFSNSVFRQGCGILAAICHLQAGLVTKKLFGIISICACIGIVYALSLAISS